MASSTSDSGPASAKDLIRMVAEQESAKAAEVTRIEGLIASLQADVAAKQAEAERLAAEFTAAQIEYETAFDKATSLQAQADAETARAAETARKLGRLAAQQYRSGGDDAALDLFFSGSAASADDLLAKLGTMDRLVEANRGRGYGDFLHYHLLAQGSVDVVIESDVSILDVAALVNLVTRGEEDRLTPHKHHTAFSALTNSSTAVQSGR